MRKLFLGATTLALAAGLMTTGAIAAQNGGPPTKSSAKVVELKLGHFMSPKHPLHRGVFIPPAEKIAKESGGELTIKIFDSGKLGKGPVAHITGHRTWSLPDGTAGVSKLERVPGPRHHLGVSQDDFPRLTGGDGKDPGSDCSLTQELDQCRISFSPDDLFINGAGSGRIHRFSAKLLVPLKQREIVEYGFSGQRVDIVTLPQAVAIVPEEFLHLHQGHPPGDRDDDIGPQFYDIWAGSCPRQWLNPALGRKGLVSQESQAQSEQKRACHS